MSRRRVLYALEVAGAVLYLAWLAHLLVKDDDMTYAKVVHVFARMCRYVAGHVGHAGVIAELHYKQLIEAGRMN